MLMLTKIVLLFSCLVLGSLTIYAICVLLIVAEYWMEQIFAKIRSHFDFELFSVSKK